MSTFLNVLLVILLILVVVLAVLYFLGRKLEKRQVEQQQALEAAAQTVSMLVIDKKKMKLKDAGLPKIISHELKTSRFPFCDGIPFRIMINRVKIIHFSAS